MSFMAAIIQVASPARISRFKNCGSRRLYATQEQNPWIRSRSLSVPWRTRRKRNVILSKVSKRSLMVWVWVQMRNFTGFQILLILDFSFFKGENWFRFRFGHNFCFRYYLVFFSIGVSLILSNRRSSKDLRLSLMDVIIGVWFPEGLIYWYFICDYYHLFS